MTPPVASAMRVPCSVSSRAARSERPETAGVLLPHNTGGAEALRPGLPVRLHIADPDTYRPAAEVTALGAGA